MKKLASLLILLVFSLSSCEGPSGPPGSPGPSGTNIVGKTYEEFKVSFTASNNFSTRINLKVNTVDSDVILGYILWGTEGTEDNPIWRPLPQTIMFDNGDQLIYQYDFTKNRIELFLDANFDLSTLVDKFRINQVFRFVVVPADFANKMSKNASYEEVTTALKIQSKDFKN